MAKKAVNLDVEVLKETEEQLVVRANKPLKKDEFNLLSDLVKKQEEESGIKIVVLPYSADLVGEQDNEEVEKKIEEEVSVRVKAELKRLEKERKDAEDKAKMEAEEKAKKEATEKVKKEAAEKEKKEKEADK